MDIEEILNKTMKVVKECSAYICDKLNAEEKGTKIKQDGSFVTKYDLEIDKQLTDNLKKIIDIPVLSEEHNEELGKKYFVIDPIDGTHNFNIGFECFGIMVALVENKKTLFSIIELPFLKKTFIAIKDKGAYLNNERIFANKNIRGNLVGNINLDSKDSLELINKVIDKKDKIEFRSLYCAAVAFGYIACGIFDFSIHIGRFGSWDIIAPELLLNEAGATCKVLETKSGKRAVIACENSKIELIEKMIINS